MVYTPFSASNVAVPGGVTLPTSDWFSKMPSELLAVCAAPMLDPTNPNANAENASNPVPLFFRYTMNVSLLDGIILGQVTLEPRYGEDAKSQFADSCTTRI
jgi:hypothetical protein